MRSVQSVSKLSLSVLTLMGVMMCSPLAMAGVGGRASVEAEAGAGVPHRGPTAAAASIEGEDEKQRHPFDVVEEGHPLFAVKEALREVIVTLCAILTRASDSFSHSQYEMAVNSPDNEDCLRGGAITRELIAFVEKKCPKLEDRMIFLLKPSYSAEEGKYFNWCRPLVSSESVIEGYLFKTLLDCSVVCLQNLVKALDELPNQVTFQTVNPVLKLMQASLPVFDEIRDGVRSDIGKRNFMLSALLGTGREIGMNLFRGAQPYTYASMPHFSVAESIDDENKLGGIVIGAFVHLKAEFGKTIETLREKEKVLIAEDAGKKVRLEIASNLLRSSALPLETILATTSLSEADLRDAGILPVESDAVAAHN